eukprot:2976404-Rhodomonas_salina.1
MTRNNGLPLSEGFSQHSCWRDRVQGGRGGRSALGLPLEMTWLSQSMAMYRNQRHDKWEHDQETSDDDMQRTHKAGKQT